MRDRAASIRPFQLSLLAVLAASLGCSSGGSGADGSAALVLVTEEVGGVNCTTGGQRIDSGLDDGLPGGTAGDGTLQPAEVDATSFVCNGADGRLGVSLVAVTELPVPNPRCSGGGIQVDTGLDDGAGEGTAGDGTLDAGEVRYTYFVCDGEDGTDGVDGADGVDGTNGIDGTDGIDGTNGVDGTDGVNGFTSLVRVVTVGTGTGCAVSGVRIDVGLDNGDGDGTARDGVLHADEVDHSETVCDGTNGTDGTDGTNGVNGYNSLVRVATVGTGAGCAAGGVRIDVGLDDGSGDGAPRDGILDDDEVDHSQTVCNGTNGTDGTDGTNGSDGAAGYSSLVRVVSVGTETGCAVSGVRIDVGLDDGSGDGTPRDGILDDDEVDDSETVCDADSGGSSGGLVVRDSANQLLGPLVSADDYTVKVLTADGHLVVFNWDGTPVTTTTYFLTADCSVTVTSPAFRYATAQLSPQQIHWGYLAGASAPVPFTLSAWEGSKTPASRTMSTGGTCTAYTTAREATYTLTQTTRAALHLPATIVGPLLIGLP